MRWINGELTGRRYSRLLTSRQSMESIRNCLCFLFNAKIWQSGTSY